jgi:hypothetical protein
MPKMAKAAAAGLAVDLKAVLAALVVDLSKAVPAVLKAAPVVPAEEVARRSPARSCPSSSKTH